jgi:hypothetical protein
VLALTESADKVGEFVAAARSALAEPLAAGGPELDLAARRMASLRRHPLESDATAAVTRCTGELGVVAGEALVDPKTPAGLTQIEQWRRAAFSSARAAFGVAGPSPFGRALASALERGGDWPRGAAVDDAPSNEDAWGAYAAPGQRAGTARVRLAVWLDRADEAVATAASLGGSGTLAARLSGLAVPFRLADVAGTVRPHGGCVAVTLETVRAAGASALEDGAAAAAAITRQELERQHRSFEEDDGLAPQGGGLPRGGQRAVRRASDPREAAALAAWWSLSEPSDRGAGRMALAFGLAPPSLDPRGGKTDLETTLGATGQRFWAAFERADKSLRAPLIDHRARLERGQGELWLLLASPCGTASEGDSDAGLAALSLWGAVLARGADDRSVTLEPWITPDGVGVIAHAPRGSFESPGAEAARIAEHAARTLTTLPLGADAVTRARGALLGWIGEGPSAEGRALAAAAGALVPGHPSWLAPLGGWDALARAGAEVASTHWASLAQGPLRLAVLVEDDVSQGEVAARTIDRWMVRRGEAPKSCPPAPDAPAPKFGTIPVELAGGPDASQALVALPAPPPGTPERPLAELAVAALSGADGWLARALATAMPGASIEPRLVGGARAAALVIDIRAPEGGLESAVAQTRGVLARMRQGALTAADLDRALAVRRKAELEASLDPRRRLVELWKASSVAPPAAPSLETWKAWAASALAEDRVVVVLGRPKR